ncbi:hypothetical protein MA16_Dca003226 [Dendrobium catenatum]|uniref:rRNA adenine N(6)-methyltransferase n=1 Tax=Dendrobium catenatum TaxID=906689 RepID=A0A2I0XC62_9ASPA|nr:hypothetical protein MA16_Dca003226 [Dendrobium catenatum]
MECFERSLHLRFIAANGRRSKRFAGFRQDFCRFFGETTQTVPNGRIRGGFRGSDSLHVDAAIVKFKLKRKSEYPQVMSKNGFFSMVNSAFNGKRKMLRKSLQHICSAPKIEDALREVGLQETARPQELTLEDFVRLYNLLSKTDQSIPQSVIQIQ